MLREREAEAVADAVMAEIASRHARRARSTCSAASAQSLRLVAARARAPPRRPLGGRGRACWPRRPRRSDLIALLDVLVSPATTCRSRARCAARCSARPTSTCSRSARRRPKAASWWRALRELRGAEPPALERARSLLGALARGCVAALPPHDLLDRIVAEGDAHARYAAAVPPEQRAFALDAIDAVLGAGARLSTAAATRRPMASCARSRSAP